MQWAARQRGHHAEERHHGGFQRSEGLAGMGCGCVWRCTRRMATFTRQGCLSGHYFWVLDKNKLPGPAQSITQAWGVPSPIDTVFTRCNCQGKTYIFKVCPLIPDGLFFPPFLRLDPWVWMGGGGPCRETNIGDLKTARWTRVTPNPSNRALTAFRATSPRRCPCLSTGRGESPFTSSREVMKTSKTH